MKLSQFRIVVCLSMIVSLWPRLVSAQASGNSTNSSAPSPVAAPVASPVAASPTTTEAGPWSGCVDPSDPQAKVTIGQPTMVCLQMANTEDWSAGAQYIRLSFAPQADQYSRLYIPNSYTDLVKAGQSAADSIWYLKNVTVGAASQTALSFLRLYFDSYHGKIYPYLTAIIDVRGGVVAGITWDNACVFCGGGTCDEITFNFNGVSQTQQSSGQPTQGCFLSIKECDADNTQCDVTLYVVWTGTDSKGVSFQSSASRFSAFPPQRLQDRLTQNLPQELTQQFAPQSRQLELSEVEGEYQVPVQGIGSDL